MATNLDSTPKTEVENSKEHAADWNEHEHVSEQVQLEAEKLIDMVGTPALAQEAIRVVEKKRPSQSTPDSELAASLAKSRQASAQISDAFLKSLTDLETSLATPVVSGELTEWLSNALRYSERVRALLLGDLQKIHSELYSSIVRQSVDLSAQVEKLRAADTQISHADCDELISSLKRLHDEARSARQDEAKLTEDVAKISKRAMDFVVAARGQETAISTWLSEAFNRDTGSGD